MPGRRICRLPQWLGKLMPLAVVIIFATPCSSRYNRKDNDPMARRIRVHNMSDSTIEVYWMNLHTEERFFQFDLVPGKTDALNTHFIHEFEIVEVANPKTGICGGKKGVCRKRHFQISEYEDQLFTVNAEFRVEVSNSQSRAKSKAKSVLKKCRNLKKDASYGALSPTDQMDILTQCVQEQVDESLTESYENVFHDSTLRSRLSMQLASYACHDTKHEETVAIFSKEWDRTGDDADDKNHTMKMYFEVDATIIASVENVLTPSDCNMIEEMAQLDETGVPAITWAPSENPRMGRVLSKIYKYINPALSIKGLSVGMPQPGQRLMELHSNATIPTQSNESWSVNGVPMFGRVLLFCKAPVVGGAIHFLESGTHVHPQPGQALLITYTMPSPDGEDNLAANFRNIHIDCPVVDGDLTAVEHVFRVYS